MPPCASSSSKFYPTYRRILWNHPHTGNLQRTLTMKMSGIQWLKMRWMLLSLSGRILKKWSCQMAYRFQWEWRLNQATLTTNTTWRFARVLTQIQRLKTSWWIACWFIGISCLWLRRKLWIGRTIHRARSLWNKSRIFVRSFLTLALDLFIFVDQTNLPIKVFTCLIIGIAK